METLNSILTNPIAFRPSSELPSDEFCLGLTLSSLLSSPSIPNAQFLLSKFQTLPESLKPKSILIFLEMLIRVLENTKKIEEVASLFECSAKLSLDFNITEIKDKLRQVFHTLLDRVNVDLGLKLLKFNLSLHLDHFSSELTAEEITGLDLAVSCETKLRFSAVTKAYVVCGRSEKYSVINSLAFRCIEYVLLYEIEDTRGYSSHIEKSLKEFINCFSYEQRVKLANLYKKTTEFTHEIDNKIVVNEELLAELRKVKFTDPTLVSNDFIEFTYLIEDILQFNLPSHVIRQRVKSLHGKYQGKEFSKNLILALQAVMDDGPGFKVLEKVSNVLKPLKLLSKNEFLHYKRNEKKMNSEGYEESEVIVVPLDAKGSAEKIREFFAKLENRIGSDQERERVKKIIEELSESLKGINKNIKQVEVLGSFLLNTWLVGTDVDLNIITDNVVEKSTVLQAIRFKLTNPWKTEFINSKSKPSLNLKHYSEPVSFSITINNIQAFQSTADLQLVFLNFSPLNTLLSLIKSFAIQKSWKSPKKGTFSGYEWTLLILSFIKAETLDHSLNNAPIEDVFFRFLHFFYKNLGKVVCTETGVTEIDTKSVIGIKNLENNKESLSKIMLNRKQGQVFKIDLAKVLKSLAVI